MLEHFNKLNTPLRSVGTYQTLQSQVDRFVSRGWLDTRAWTLWGAWTDDHFLTAADRRKLDQVEPFDEWEEFALFASHYCIVHAKTSSSEGRSAPRNRSRVLPTCLPVDIAFGGVSRQGKRRFGAAMMVNNRLGQQFCTNVMGLGDKTRLRSYDIFRPQSGCSEVQLPNGGPSSRMCHSLTDIGDSGVLLVGGRASPTTPTKETWLYRRGSNQWERSHDLPVHLYRHSVTRLGLSSLALLSGGKTGPTNIFEGWLVYHPDKGWISCEVRGSLRPSAVFGSTLFCFPGPTTQPTVFSGIMAGGISDDGKIANQIVIWRLDLEVREQYKTVAGKIELNTVTGTFDTIRGLLCTGSACRSHLGASSSLE